jgi:hypothetical protein
VLALSCVFTEARDEGQVVADRYFAAAKRGDVQTVLSLYDSRFYEETPKAKWTEMYNGILRKLGRPVKYELLNWNVNTMATTSESGSFATLVYKVKYEHADGVETIGVFIPAGEKKGAIRGHHFNSDGLLR